MGGRLDLVVNVGGLDVDDVESAELSRSLRDELLAGDFDEVRPVPAGAPPAGAKAAEAIALGALMVSLAPATVGRLMEVVVSWLRRQPSSVEVEIGGHKLSSPVTREQRDAIVAAFLAQAAGPEQR